VRPFILPEDAAGSFVITTLREPKAKTNILKDWFFVYIIIWGYIINLVWPIFQVIKEMSQPFSSKILR